MVFSYFRPRHHAHQLREEMDRMLSGFFDGVAGGWRAGHGQPAVNVRENGDAMFVEMEVPGARSEQVEASVADGELSVNVQRPAAEPEGVTYHRRERPTGTRGRVLRLPADMVVDQIKAELKDGVLTITLPKTQCARPRKIKVTSAD